MSRLSTRVKTFCREEGGGEMVEAVMLIGAVILPMVFAVWQVATMVSFYYSQTGYVISLPFP
jgi:Flp pilus assembly pilin Flp